MKTFLEETLALLETKNLRRRLRLPDSWPRPRIVFEGKEVLNFCSNDYLGLADDERLCQAAREAMKIQGFGAGASRLICGHMKAHAELERKIAEFKGTESALTFSTGYMANVGIISSLFGRGDIIFSDKLNHASIIDGIILSQAEFKRYPHRDMDALEGMLKSATGFKKRLIVTDSVFSMDGDLAPLERIVELAQKYDCVVMIDEAHALGVMGQKGKGLAEHFHLEDKIDIQMGTLSKAVGAFGAYCCGSQELIDVLVNKARSFIYTTALPPAVAAAAKMGLEIIESQPQLRQRLWENTFFVHERLKELGFRTLNSQTPIIPLLTGDSDLALEFSQKLFAAGILISAIRPPTVPQNTARLRLTVMATHQRKDLEYLLEKLEEVGKELDVIN